MIKNFGFTLVETIVVVLLFAVGITVITQMFLSQNRLYRTNTAELDVTNSVRFSLDDIDNYVRQSYAVLSSYSSYTASSQTLILQIQSIDSSDRLITGSYDYVIYYVSGTNLYRVLVASNLSSRSNSTRTMATNVSALTFTLNNANYPSVTEVATSMTSSEYAGVQTRTYTGTTKTKLRD